MFWNSDILPSSVDFIKRFFDFAFVIFVLHRFSLLQSDVFWALSSCLFCFYCCVQSIEQNKCTKVKLNEKKKFGKKKSLNVVINKVCAWSIHQLLIFRVTKNNTRRKKKERSMEESRHVRCQKRLKIFIHRNYHLSYVFIVFAIRHWFLFLPAIFRSFSI